ncbi:MAG: hypothetical protein D6692_02295, partial [Planctomycetota bacterium]
MNLSQRPRGDGANDRDDLPAVKAAGGGPGGTYTWEVVQGADKVELVSPSFAGGGAPTPPGPSDATVRIHGLAPSGQLNDVQIKATWRSADGAQECSDMLELTVIVATLTFRPTDPLAVPRERISTGNDFIQNLDAGGQQFATETGWPFLGVIAPASPPEATWYTKNMEITASIQPCVDGLECVFDFKRLRQGLTGLANPTTGEGALWSSSCPQPNWCDDDAINGEVANFDEDLQLDPPPACTVFVIDAPGLDPHSPLMPCDANNQGKIALNQFTFQEWLNADGFRASGTTTWSASTELTCNAGQWNMTNTVWMNTGPSLVQAQPVVLPSNTVQNPPPAGGVRPVIAEGGRDDNPNLIEQWRREKEDALGALPSAQLLSMLRSEGSKGWGDRIKAMWGLSVQIREGRLGAEGINELIRVAHENKEVNSTRFAIELLAESRVPAAIQALLDRIDFVSPSPADTPWRGPSMPTMDALVRIGLPAVAPILERCGSEPDERWRLMAGVLRQIDKDSPLVREAMRAVLDAQAWFEEVEAAGGVPQPDEAERARRARVKQRLTEFLSTPEP